MTVYYFIYVKGGLINPRFFSTKGARDNALLHNCRVKLKEAGVDPAILAGVEHNNDIIACTEDHCGERTDWGLTYEVGEHEL